MSERPDSPPTRIDEREPRIVLEVSGDNVLIRATSDVDRACTTSLADVINAAADANTCVVIDPQPIRCDDAFAAYDAIGADRPCSQHPICRPSGAEVASPGVVRLRTERTVWLVDVRNGRFCQLDEARDHRFLTEAAWQPIVALCVTPTRVIALGVDGVLTSAARAHLQPAA
jgi:hypothetical protein